MDMMSSVKAFRSQLSALNVPNSAKPHIILKCRTNELKTIFTDQIPVLQSLVKAGQTEVIGPDDNIPEGCMVNPITEDFQALVKVVGLVDFKLELERIMKRMTQLTKLMDVLKKKMSIPNYEDKVPEAVRNDNSEKLGGYEREFSELE